jgi:hypothetical protein
MISKRRQRRSCTRKDAYSTLTGAERVAEKARARTGELIVAYPCDFCGRFHIGHLPRKCAPRKSGHADLSSVPAIQGQRDVPHLEEQTGHSRVDSAVLI